MFQLDEIMIHNRALTQVEVSALMIEAAAQTEPNASRPGR